MNCLCNKSKIIYLALGLIGVMIIIVFAINRSEPPAETMPPLVSDINQREGKEELMPRENMQWNNPPEIIIDKNANYTAVIETNKGNIRIEFFVKENPITVNNFVFLAQQGFYNGIIFHRVIDGFMIQGGCPLGTGTGGPGYAILDEFRQENKNDRGTISMANAGPNTGGSQFFINLVNNNFLDERHPAFGRVIEGMEVVDTIGNVATDRDRPIEDVVIKNIEIIKE